MKSDCIYLFSETWNLLKISSVSSDFLSPALVDINSPTFFYIPPMIPREVFNVIIGCQTLHFLIKVGVKEKGKYYLYYYMSTTLMKKKIQKFNFSRATGHIFFLDKLNFLGLFLSNIDGGWF